MASDKLPITQQGQPEADPVALNQVESTSSEHTDPSYPPQAFMKMAVFEQQSMSGPLPPAREVAAYNEVIPNGAERIMIMAETEQRERHKETHRAQEMDSRALNGFNFRGAFAQIAAFVLTVGAFSLGGYLAVNGQPDLAKDIFRITIGAVVSAFLVGQVSKAISSKKESGKEKEE